MPSAASSNRHEVQRDGGGERPSGRYRYQQPRDSSIPLKHKASQTCGGMVRLRPTDQVFAGFPVCLTLAASQSVVHLPGFPFHPKAA
ncbi:hypothetical protein E2C01_051104 [Portunus trituberculatus]|uniref:Uncharacterized protein n=1 Tax=Portunus trituberculatus TaxID=210409 RepID=A0A5B7GA36_PORTR|nr:hypothetical protein [Portunus trituberculatus]